MGDAITHLVVSLVLFGFWRRFSKKDIPLWTVLLAGFLSVIIDMDYAVDFLLRGVAELPTFHRVWTHTMLWPVILVAAAGAVRISKKGMYTLSGWTIPKDHVMYALLFSGIGLFLHLALDCALAGPFYLSWIPPGVYEGAFPFCKPWLLPKHNMVIGGGILLLWYSWMICRKNFKDVV